MKALLFLAVVLPSLAGQPLPSPVQPVALPNWSVPVDWGVRVDEITPPLCVPVEPIAALKRENHGILVSAPDTCYDMPEDAEILRALLNSYGLPCNVEAFSDDLEVVTEHIVNRVEEVGVFPVIGSVQLHHSRWKCTIYSKEEMLAARLFFPNQTTRPQVNVVYIDKDHLHLVPPHEEEERGAGFIIGHGGMP